MAGPMRTVDSGGTPGAFHYEWKATYDSLSWMKKRQRQAALNRAGEHAGYMWRETFLTKRFDPAYIKRSPFKYSGPGGISKALASLGVNKDGSPRPGVGGSGSLHDSVKGFLDRMFYGWNPYSSAKPPQQMVDEWKARNKGRGMWSASGLFGGMYGQIRQDAKAKFKEYANNLKSDGVMEPLVLTGKMRGTVFTGQIVSRATPKGQTVKVSTPMPGPRSAAAVRVIKLVPEWERTYFARQYADYIAKTKGLRDVAQQKAATKAATKKTRNVGKTNARSI
jgi:hypothetical protein